MLRILQAQPADAAELAETGRRTFYETWSFLYSEDLIQRYLQEHFSDEQIRSELEDPDVICFLARWEHEIAGYLKLSRKQDLGNWISDRCMELCRIYVYRRFQSQKVGKILMEKCIESAYSEGFDSLVLGVWEKNEKAIRFYRQFGFEIIGSHLFQVLEQTDQDLVMKKTLVTPKT